MGFGDQPPDLIGLSMQMKGLYPKSTMMKFIVLIGFICVSLVNVGEAHVALTFPQARHYDLDFLDNGRTKAPCGMPKGT